MRSVPSPDARPSANGRALNPFLWIFGAPDFLGALLPQCRPQLVVTADDAYACYCRLLGTTIVALVSTAALVAYLSCHGSAPTTIAASVYGVTRTRTGACTITVLPQCRKMYPLIDSTRLWRVSRSLSRSRQRTYRTASRVTFRNHIWYIAYRFWYVRRRSPNIPSSDGLHVEAGESEPYPAVYPTRYSAGFVLLLAERCFCLHPR